VVILKFALPWVSAIAFPSSRMGRMEGAAGDGHSKNDMGDAQA
jgi:hypothetical protein